jgi:hypothetical protein
VNLWKQRTYETAAARSSMAQSRGRRFPIEEG